MVQEYQQVKPVLAMAPGSRGAAAYTKLSGVIRFDHVSLRYSADGPLITDDVSIHFRSGEFVAIVGESEASKSTLIQMVLGQEASSPGGN